MVQEILLKIFVLAVEMCKLFLCLKVFMNLPLRKFAIQYFGAFVAGMFITEAIAMSLEAAEMFYVFMEVGTYIVMACFVFQAKLYKTIIFFFISMMAIDLFDTMLYIIITRITGMSLGQLYANWLYIFLIDSISLLLGISIIMLLKFIRKRFMIPIDKLNWRSYVLIFWILLLFVFCIGYYKMLESEQNKRIESIFLAILMMASVGVLILTIIMVRASYSRDHYKAISQLNQENLEIQQNYYTMMSEKNEDIRKFHHDIKNHLFCIHTLAKGGNPEELVRYIENLTDEMKEFTYRLHTGSNIVDAIINDAMNKHPDITFSSEGYLPNPLHIKAVDLCTIISNVINNAIEAVLKINEPGKREVAITFKNHDQFIYINATNTIAEPVTIVNNSITTSKANKELHGFGIENINNSIKKYGGNIVLNSTEVEFIVEIILKNMICDRSPQKSDR